MRDDFPLDIEQIQALTEKVKTFNLITQKSTFPKDSDLILDKIHSHKLKEVAENKKHISIDVLKERCKESPKTRNLGEVIKRNNRIKIIAEVKKASPSAGIIREDFNYVNIAM